MNLWIFDNMAFVFSMFLPHKRAQIAKRKQPIKINYINLEEVEKFTYLGSIVNIEGGTDADVKNRINKVRVHLQYSRESMESCFRLVIVLA
jgi:hypothetical protein